MLCANGHQNYSDAHFCRVCSIKLDHFICANGHENDGGSPFCLACGIELSHSTAPIPEDVDRAREGAEEVPPEVTPGGPNQ